jgi:hypothetical protein
MADPEHLEILRRGVEVWDEWANRLTSDSSGTVLI